MTKFFALSAAVLLLAACGGDNQDRLDNLAAAEGTASGNDAELNGSIDADREAEALPTAPVAPPEKEAANDVDPLAPVPTAAPTGPSFDCANAWRDVEREICADEDLAALDRNMARNYYRALRTADPARATILQQSGAAFIRNRNRCPDGECIAQAYRWRITEIADIMGNSR